MSTDAPAIPETDLEALAEQVNVPAPVMIGQMVHYWPTTSKKPYPAFVMEILASDPAKPILNLTVFYSSGVAFKREVPHSPAPVSGRWTWPK